MAEYVGEVLSRRMAHGRQRGDGSAAFAAAEVVEDRVAGCGEREHVRERRTAASEELDEDQDDEPDPHHLPGGVNALG